MNRTFLDLNDPMNGNMVHFMSFLLKMNVFSRKPHFTLYGRLPDIGSRRSVILMTQEFSLAA